MMILPVTTWLVYTIILSVSALFVIWSRQATASKRWIAVLACIASAIVSLPAALMPMSMCAPWRPASGEYGVLGFKIDQPNAIYVLLDNGATVPRCFTLPYSTAKANGLQDAAEAGGGKGIKVKVHGAADSEEGETYEGPPPVMGMDPDKMGETPAFSVE